MGPCGSKFVNLNLFLVWFQPEYFRKAVKMVFAGNSMSTACQVNKPTLDNVRLDCQWASGLSKVTLASTGETHDTLPSSAQQPVVPVGFRKGR